MSKKRSSISKKVTTTLATGLALAVFIVPSILAGFWFVTANSNHDPRTVVPTTSFQARLTDVTQTPLRPFKEPIVSITFDDGWESVYTQAFPILQQTGFHTTQYIITGTFTNPLYMSVPQLRAMQAAGTQIGSHTITHPDLTTLSASELVRELAKSQSTLEHDFGGDVRDFTSPYGAYNAYTLATIAEYYRSQKNAEGTADSPSDISSAINIGDGFDPMNFSSFSIRHDTTLADIQTMIRDTINTNGWLVLTYHQVDNSDGEYSVSPTDFKRQMELVSKSSVRSATVDQIMNVLLPAEKTRG